MILDQSSELALGIPCLKGWGWDSGVRCVESIALGFYPVFWPRKISKICVYLRQLALLLKRKDGLENLGTVEDPLPDSQNISTASTRGLCLASPLLEGGSSLCHYPLHGNSSCSQSQTAHGLVTEAKLAQSSPSLPAPGTAVAAKELQSA